jgi:hypothetical protein
MDFFDGLYFLIKLPYYIIHIVTFRKFAEKESEQATFKSIAITLVVFSVLITFCVLMFRLKETLE